MKAHCRCLNCIMPPHLLKKLLESKDRSIREAALQTLLTTTRLRGERHVRSIAGVFPTAANGARSIYDCHHKTRLPGATLARAEGANPTSDVSVNQAYDGFGKTRDFYQKIFDRNSVDNRGMRLDGYVHRGIAFNNAFWDGQEMIFGDGDGILFTDFTDSLDVIAHELTHGVTEFTANLEYHNQSGALNESVSDVFGSMVKQWTLGQTVDQADWLIGAEVFTPSVKGDALRSLKAPGTAYDNEQMGKDPQPDNFQNYLDLPDTEDGDFGGVHINSGIPNKAFYLAATGIGGYSWEEAGHIWYTSLLASNPQTDFSDFASTTWIKAGQLYGSGSHQQQAIAAAWDGVGVKLSGASAASRLPDFGRVTLYGGTVSREKEGEQTLDLLRRQVAQLSTEMKDIRDEVMKRRGNGAPTVAPIGANS